MNIENLISSIMLTAALIPLLLFIYFYNKYSPWKETPIGRILMLQKIIVSSYLIFVIVTFMAPDFFGRDTLRFAIIYPGMAIAHWLMFTELIKVIKGKRKNRNLKEEAK